MGVDIVLISSLRGRKEASSLGFIPLDNKFIQACFIGFYISAFIYPGKDIPQFDLGITLCPICRIALLHRVVLIIIAAAYSDMIG